jgi:hypothetical protein
MRIGGSGFELPVGVEPRRPGYLSSATASASRFTDPGYGIVREAERSPPPRGCVFWFTHGMHT